MTVLKVCTTSWADFKLSHPHTYKAITLPTEPALQLLKNRKCPSKRRTGTRSCVISFLGWMQGKALPICFLEWLQVSEGGCAKYPSQGEIGAEILLSYFVSVLASTSSPGSGTRLSFPKIASRKIMKSRTSNSSICCFWNSACYSLPAGWWQILLDSVTQWPFRLLPFSL